MAIGTFLDLPQKFGTALKSTTGGGSGPSKRLVPEFNGVSQYATLNITLTSSNTVKIKFIALPGSGIFLDSADRSAFINFRSDGTIQRASNIGNLKLDGVLVVNSTTPYPADGLVHEFEFTPNADAIIDTIACEYRRDRSFINKIIFDLIVDDGAVYNYPMDDGFENNPVMRNAGTGSDGAFINATEAMWKLK